jgi:hypothetical protein
MFEWLKNLFRDSSIEDGRKFAIESLETGRHTRDELFDMSEGMGLGRTAFDEGIRQVLHKTNLGVNDK